MRHRQRQQSSTNEATNSKITRDKSSDCQYLKYGQDFMLECYDSKQKPLMLYSSPKSPFISGHSDYVFKSHGEMKQSIGLALQKANATDETSTSEHVTDASIPSKYFHWRMYHINPEVRYETIGENIPVRTRQNYIIHNGLKPNVVLWRIENVFAVESHIESSQFS